MTKLPRLSISKMNTYFKLLLAGFLFSGFSAISQNPDTDSIARYTQRLISGIATGDTSSWHEYLDDSCLITSENGTVKTKQEFIRGVGIPPASYTVTEKLANPVFRSYNNVTVFCYTAVLSLKLSGQERITRICQTDTWMKKNGFWRLISSAALDKPDLPAGQTPEITVIKAITGKYQLTDKLGYEVFSDSGKLFIQRYGAPRKNELICESDFIFFVENNPLLRYIFIHQGNLVTEIDVRRQGSGFSFPKIK
jgi:hypothetical protein